MAESALRQMTTGTEKLALAFQGKPRYNINP